MRDEKKSRQELIQELEQSRSRERALQSLLDNVSEEVALLGRDLQCVYRNRTSSSGEEPKDFLRETTESFGVPPEILRSWPDTFNEVFHTRESRSIDYSLPSHAGERFYQLRVIPEPAPDGTIERLMCITRDKTDRRHAEHCFRRTMAFEGVIKQVLPHFATCPLADTDSTVVHGLQEIAQFLGADHAYIVNISPYRESWNCTHEWCAPHVPSAKNRYQGLPMGTMPWTENKTIAGEIIRINSRDDYPPEALPERIDYMEEGAVSILNLPIRNISGQVSGCIGIHTHARPAIWSEDDILKMRIVGDAIACLLERKRLDEELQKSHDELERRVQERTAELTEVNSALRESENQLKVLSSRLLTIQEHERGRVACEIHDSIGQSLHAIKSGMNNLYQQMRETLSAPGLEEAFEDLMGVVDFSIEEVRAIYTGLKPLILDDLGILATVGWFIRECRKTYPDITVEEQICVREEEVPESLKIVIFRFLQAAVDNITRHSKADRARISLEMIDGNLELRIEDNGVGFSMEDVALEKKPGEALGIAIMQERVESSGGIFALKSAKGERTTIRAFWDLSRFT